MRFISLVLAGVMFGAPVLAEPASRIVGAGGSVTEIIYALGAEDRLIARDSTSSFPPEVQDLPDVGYIRRLSAEGVLSVNPDLIIAEADAGPAETVDLLRAAAIPFVLVPEAMDADSLARKVTAVGAALGLEDAAAGLADDLRKRVEAAQAHADRTGASKKRVMFILSAREGRILASGENTSADAMIRLAGGINAIEGFEGYKTLSDEAISLAAPDVILMMDRGGDHSASDEKLFSMASLAVTPAAQTQSVIRMNGLYLLGFGPRTAAAIEDLSEHLYGG